MTGTEDVRRAAPATGEEIDALRDVMRDLLKLIGDHHHEMSGICGDDETFSIASADMRDLAKIEKKLEAGCAPVDEAVPFSPPATSGNHHG